MIDREILKLNPMQLAEKGVSNKATPFINEEDFLEYNCATHFSRWQNQDPAKSLPLQLLVEHISP